mgnify:CR=1 FL=1|jgi:uncharacterized protein YcsI (UPF0317 family)|tara:strand:- start:5112 stop:5924 length:813 start_codon:yes stop_codon:yes gene_type:complete
MLDIQNSKEARKVIRENNYTEQTAGTANKHVQGNVCILPSKYATDFASFCQKNPKPCPLIGFGTKGDPMIKDLGDIDIRTDVPQYRIWKNGELIDEPLDINKYWNDDLVTFILGCSMSFELPLIEAGIEIQHIQNDTIVPMYRTSIDCVSAGQFSGKLVVSMRPLKSKDAIRSIQITSKYPAVHGAPIHLGNPEEIGIKDLMKPEYGDPPRSLNNNEIPVFWACGVTPQSVLEISKPEFCITHSPGKMLITDKLNNELTSFKFSFPKKLF